MHPTTGAGISKEKDELLHPTIHTKTIQHTGSSTFLGEGKGPACGFRMQGLATH